MSDPFDYDAERVAFSIAREGVHYCDCMLEGWLARARIAAEREMEMREKVRLLHDATIVLRNGMGGHNHWDHTMRRGAGCEVCLKQREAVDEANRLIEEAGKLTALAKREERG